MDESIREELRRLGGILEKDEDEFEEKWTNSRRAVFDHLDEYLQQLMRMKTSLEEDFDYRRKENQRTCDDNQREFAELCKKINRADEEQVKRQLLNEFQQRFDMRPRMIKDIPQFDLQLIDLDPLIQRRHPTIIEDDPPQTSLGHSLHQHFAQQNVETTAPSPPRLTSSVSTVSASESMVDTLYRIPYPNPRCPHLLTCADDDHCLVVHQIASRHFLCIDVRTRAETRVDLPFQDLLNLGFCSTTHSFYLTTRKSKSVHFFLVHGQEMQIVDEIHLLGDHEIFLNVHIDGDSLRYLYLSSKIVMLGCFHLVSRTRQPAFSFDNRLYDVDHKSPFRLIDFVVDRSSIAFLIQLKKNDKYMIRICNLDRMDALHSFDLVDAGKPSSITCTNTRYGWNSPLLFVTDSRNHLIHCCTFEEYLAPIQINAYAVCPLDDGNLSLVANKDIRALKVQKIIFNE